MPDLFHSLQKQDIGHLRIIAELWGFELDSSTKDEALEELSTSLLDPNLLAELIDTLSSEANSAITSIIDAGGRISWVTFTRQHGDIREAGAGKRDREKLYRNPTSTSEILYYHGLLARAFFETEKGPQEFAFIPDDLLPLIPRKGGSGSALTINIEPLGRPASPGERGQKETLANDAILDDATTLLAALRTDINIDSASSLANLREQAPRLHNLLTTAKLINKGIINTDKVKIFLESPRSDAMSMLQDAWLESGSFNELKLMPSINCEGEWKNQPLETRDFLLELLDAIPENKWWSLNAFVRDVKAKYADFQRPA
ncbi:MAG TPA: hypothetical protein VLA72_21890, partial [Anaerolineales bacterium]|nr:hypothetical protein [Anaerolineales bacterium]